MPASLRSRRPRGQRNPACPAPTSPSRDRSPGRSNPRRIPERPVPPPGVQARLIPGHPLAARPGRDPPREPGPRAAPIWRRALSRARAARSPQRPSPRPGGPTRAVHGRRRASRLGRSPTPSLPCRPPEPVPRSPAARRRRPVSRATRAERARGAAARRTAPRASPPWVPVRTSGPSPGQTRATASRASRPCGRGLTWKTRSACSPQYGEPRTARPRTARTDLRRRRCGIRAPAASAPARVICPGVQPGRALSGPARPPVWTAPPCGPTRTSARTPARTARRWPLSPRR